MGKNMYFDEIQEIFQTITAWPIIGWPIVIIYLLLFCSILYYLLVMAPLVISSKNWPNVTGKIIKSELENRGTRDNIEGTYTMEYSANWNIRTR